MFPYESGSRRISPQTLHHASAHFLGPDLLSCKTRVMVASPRCFLGAYSEALRTGRNILALQGVNRASTNRDFLLQVRLRGEESELLKPSGYHFRVRVVE